LIVKLVDSRGMAEIDRRSQEEFGMPSILLMENAGIKAHQAWKRRVLKGKRPEGGLTFVAGKGNNGGDALVMARQCLLDGVPGVSVVLADGRPAEGTDPGANLRMCESLGVPVVSWPEREKAARDLISTSGWVFDGIAGTGLRGALRGPLAAVVEAINASRGRKVAIDVPSGVGDGFKEGFPAVHADVTLCMGLPKTCLYLPRARLFCGRIIVVPLGFPPALADDPAIPGELLEEKAFRFLASPIPVDSHKNRRGHLAVFAGSPGTTGAAVLTATAAARARVGLVTVFLDAETYALIAPRFSSVMARPWAGSGAPERSGFDPGRFSALLVGPGWGVTEEKRKWLHYLLSLEIPGVIDADGLTLLGRSSSSVDRPKGMNGSLSGRWVLTPHPGEFSRISGAARDEILDDPVAHALSLAKRMEGVVVLKGACTCVAEPGGRYWIFDGVNPALGTGGSGDVLAGIIAAAIAGGMDILGAALFGVSLHGRIGRIARSKMGWFLAEDMLPLVSSVLGREA
jgi:hydroxyethylthiazole kinase-like uncharacterized protein yjeF